MSRKLRPFTTAIVCIACTLVGCGSGSSKKNAAPTAVEVAATTLEDVAFVGNFNASDPDGDTLTYSIVTQPTRGTVQIGAGNSFTYTPAPDANGQDEFTYRASDARATSAAVAVRIQVTPVNDAPRIQAALNAVEDDTLVVDVATDPEADAMIMKISSGPTHGTVVIVSESHARIEYRPSPNYHGADSFALEISDGQAAPETATIAIEVQSVNDIPVAADDSAWARQNVPITVDVVVNDSDVDGDTLLASIVEAPSHGTASITSDGKIKYSPEGFIGSTQLAYRIDDGQGGSATATLAIDSKLASPAIYLAREGTHPAYTYAVYLADGLRTRKLPTPHSDTAKLRDLQRAKHGPLACYLATLGTATDVYCIDLRASDPAPIRMNDPARGAIGIYFISDNGDRVVYSNVAGVWLIDTARPASERRLGDGGSGLIVNGPATWLAYSDVRFTPTMQPSRVYVMHVDSGEITPVSPLAQPPESAAPKYLTNDGRRLYYSIGNGPGVVTSVDTNDLNDSYTVYDFSTPGAPSFFQCEMNEDESAFHGLASSAHGHVLTVGPPASLTSFTSGTPVSSIYDHAVNRDASRAYYLRANAGGLYSLLYAVDMAAPSVSTQIGTQPSVSLGINSFELSNDESRIVYSTTDMVPFGGGSVGPGNSEIFVLNLADISTSPVVHSEFALEVKAISPDDGVAIIEQRNPSSPFPRLHALNLRDLSQFIRLDNADTDTGVVESVLVNGPPSEHEDDGGAP